MNKVRVWVLLVSMTPWCQAADLRDTLSLIERSQPALAQDMIGWEAWEAIRLSAFEKAGRWAQAVDRVDLYGIQLSADFLFDAHVRQAQAHLQLGQGTRARVTLRGLIWNDHSLSVEQLTQLRVMVIRSYLLDQSADDAYVAARKLRQDGHAEDVELTALYIRALLLTARYPRAADVLSSSQALDDVVLLQIANLLSEQGSTEGVWAGISALLADINLDADVRQYGWQVLATVADSAGMHDERLRALEQALVSTKSAAPMLAHTLITADDLWDAYVQAGQRLGNQHQLLIGDDAAWLAAADDSGQARYMLAVVALSSADERFREEAHRRLNSTIPDDIHGHALRALLYRGTARVPYLMVPESIRLQVARESVYETL